MFVSDSLISYKTSESGYRPVRHRQAGQVKRKKEKKKKKEGRRGPRAYRVQPIDLLGLWCLVTTTTTTVHTVRTHASTAEKASGGRSADGATERAHLRLGGAFARFPRGLERLKCALRLLPCRPVPRLELGLVRVDECTWVLHAQRRRLRANRHTVGYRDRRRNGGGGATTWRRKLAEVCVRIELGEQLLLLLLRIAVAGLLRLLIAVASLLRLLLRWIARVLSLNLRLGVARGERVDLAEELLTIRVRRLEARRRVWGLLQLWLVLRLLLLLLLLLRPLWLLRILLGVPCGICADKPRRLVRRLLLLLLLLRPAGRVL